MPMYKNVLLISSSLATLTAISRIITPLYFPRNAGLVPEPIRETLAEYSQLEGLTSLFLAALYCTVARTASPSTLRGLSTAHAIVFFGILYIWTNATSAGIDAYYLSTGLVFNGVIALILGSEASFATGRQPTVKSRTYTFTMILSTVNFLAFVVAFFRPARFASIVLGGAQAPGYNVLLAHIQMGSLKNVIISALLCTGAASGTRSFSLGIAAAATGTVFWAVVNSFMAPAGTCACELLWFAAANAFVAVYYFFNAPASAPLPSPINRPKID